MEGYGNENPGAFQPTRPLRGATEIAHKLTDTIKFQPTRPLRGATRPASSGSACRSNFNPRAPCGARPWWCAASRRWNVFQPTRPLRGATEIQQIPPNLTIFQPTRPLRGATVKLWHWIVRRNISTHAPLAGRDVLCECNPSAIIGNFNPRAPCGARRRMAFKHCGQKENFNPRAPCGARQTGRIRTNRKRRFQPTRPLRGATQGLHSKTRKAEFQPTRPLRGATNSTEAKERNRKEFQPTRPLRGATTGRFPV